MKVEKPRFDDIEKTVHCCDCPLEGVQGGGALSCRATGETDCPTAETYQAALAAADGKGEKGYVG